MTTQTPATSLAAPYRGLAPFGESELDALLFFGRERETEIGVANLIASRLTILYGPSGVGKSSLLRAGVARRVRKLGARDPLEPADLACVVFSSWADDPLPALAAAVAAEVQPLVPTASPPPTDAPLADAVDAWSNALGGDICLILDQFEEAFVYHEDGAGLVEDIAELVTRPGLRANVLLSLRDDALSQLDVFKRAIPHLYANSLRLDRLDRRAARAAILGPVQQWNDLVPADQRVSIEPALVDEVVTQARVAGEVDRVEPPYLQLVMERVWYAEHDAGSRVLRRSTLLELGGAHAIVQAHLDRALGHLDPAEQDAAARMFEHLVTPSGTKIAHRASDLAQFARLGTAAAAPVLAALGRERILRPLDEAEGVGGRYEIFHDVLAGAILDWRRRRLLDEERVAARRRQRRLAAGLIAALALLVVMLGVTVYALDQRSTAHKQTELAVAAQQEAEANAAAERKQKQRADVALEKSQKSQEQTERLLHKEQATEKKLERALKNEQAAKAGLVHQTQVANDQTQLARGQTQLARSQTRLAKEKTKELGSALGRERKAKELANQKTRLSNRQRNQLRKINAQLRATGASLKASSLAYNALSNVFVNPEQTLALALDANELGKAPTLVERALRLGLLATKGTRILAGGGGAVSTATYDPSGTRVLTGAAHGARIYDAGTSELLRELPTSTPVTAAAWSHSGALVALATAGGEVVVANPDTGKSAYPLRQHASAIRHDRAVTSVSFSRDDRLIATSSEDRTAAVWDAASGLPVQRFDTGGIVRSAAFTPDGSQLLVVTAVFANQGPARLYDIATGAIAQRFVTAGQITTAAVSPDGTLVATGGRDDIAVLWNAGTGARLHRLVGHSSDVTSVTFSPDGTQLATTSNDVTTRLWRVPSGEPRFQLVGHTTTVVAAAFNPDGTRLVTAGSDRTARVWRTNDSAQEAVLLGHAERLAGASFSPDGMRVVTAAADGDARVWDPVGEPRLRFVGSHTGRAFGASFAGDGRRLATAGADGTARVWDVGRRRQLAVLSAGVPLNDAAFTRDGGFVAAAGSDGIARVWRATGGGPTLFGAAGRPLHAVAFSPDGTLLAVAGEDGNATVWRWRSDERLYSIRHPAGTPVLDVAFAPDGRLLATGADDGVARLWRVADGRFVRELRGHTDGVTGVAFSADGKRLATSSRDRDARLFDVATRVPVRTFRGHSALVSGVAVAADGKWVATAGPIKAGVWATSGHDLAGDRLHFLVGHTNTLTSVAFAPQSHVIATTSFDGTVRTFRCVLCGDVRELAAAARARLHVLGKR